MSYPVQPHPPPPSSFGQSPPPQPRRSFGQASSAARNISPELIVWTLFGLKYLYDLRSGQSPPPPGSLGQISSVFQWARSLWDSRPAASLGRSLTRTLPPFLPAGPLPCSIPFGPNPPPHPSWINTRLVISLLSSPAFQGVIESLLSSDFVRRCIQVDNTEDSERANTSPNVNRTMEQATLTKSTAESQIPLTVRACACSLSTAAAYEGSRRCTS